MIFKRYENNPIIKPDLNSSYESHRTYNPTAIVHENKIYLIYRGQSEANRSVSKLCMAISKDGYTFKKYDKNPIIYPTLPEEKGGCEDPRVTKINNT